MDRADNVEMKITWTFTRNRRIYGSRVAHALVMAEAAARAAFESEMLDGMLRQTDVKTRYTWDYRSTSTTESAVSDEASLRSTYA